MNELSKEDVLKVARLAMLKIEDTDINKYQEELNVILGEINKILNVNIDTNDLLISPNVNINNYYENIESSTISKNDIFFNTKNENEGYLSVPKVIND